MSLSSYYSWLVSLPTKGYMLVTLLSEDWLHASCLCVSIPCGLSTCSDPTPASSYENTSPCMGMLEACILVPFLSWCLGCSEVSVKAQQGNNLVLLKPYLLPVIIHFYSTCNTSYIHVSHRAFFRVLQNKKAQTTETRWLHWVKNGILTQAQTEVLFETHLLCWMICVQFYIVIVLRTN